MKTRTAKKINPDVSADEFEAAMAKYSIVEYREQVINRMIEQETGAIMDKYKEELSCIEQIKNATFEIMQSYCISNKQSLFCKRRSIGTLYGVAGFRLGTPRLKTLKGTNWQLVLGELKNKLPGYVRTIEEPAKDLLLADRHKEHVAPLLVEMGLQVVQDELFYIETKKAA